MSSSVATKSGKTFLPKVDHNNKKWWIVDLEGVTLGRTATKVADILHGKNKPIYTPHMDVGDHVVVINAEKVKVSGDKEKSIKYYRYSGYPGGLSEVALEKMRSKHPERIFEHAVRGMLPKTRLGRSMFRKLHVYAGTDHPHEAQQPEKLTFA